MEFELLYLEVFCSESSGGLSCDKTGPKYEASEADMRSTSKGLVWSIAGLKPTFSDAISRINLHGEVFRSIPILLLWHSHRVSMTHNKASAKNLNPHKAVVVRATTVVAACAPHTISGESPLGA